MTYSSIIAPKVAEGWVSHQTNLGVNSYDLDELYSPDTAFQRSKVLDAVSPKYSPNKTYIFDRSAYRNHGTITGATWTRLPSGLWVLSFDGDDYVQVTNAASLQLTTAISIEAWVNPSLLGVYGILEKGPFDNNYGDYTLLMQSNGKIRFALNAANGLRDAATALVASVPSHVVATYSTTSQRMKLYINGVKEAVETTYSTAISTSDNNLHVGQYYGAGYHWVGLIGLVRLHGTELSATTITQHYQQERHLFGV